MRVLTYCFADVYRSFIVWKQPTRQQQNIAAAWPSVLGIFSGHIYHFFTKVWPALGGKAWLQPPKWFVKRFGERKSNIAGLDFSAKEETGKKGKKRPLTKGKKLGSTKK
jgi:hypothetical protein